MPRERSQMPSGSLRFPAAHTRQANGNKFARHTLGNSNACKICAVVWTWVKVWQNCKNKSRFYNFEPMSSESAEVLSQTISRFSVEETEELVDLIGNFKAIIFLLIELLQLYN